MLDLNRRMYSPPRPFARLLCMLLLALVPALSAPSLHAAEADEADDAPLRFRVRTLSTTPSQPCMVQWTYGGRGLSGDPVYGVITHEQPAPPSPADMDEGEDFMAMLEGGPKDRIIVKGDTFDVHYLNPGVWSRSHPLRSLPDDKMTIAIAGHETGAALTDSTIEFEITWKGKVIKTFQVYAAVGHKFGIIIPYRDLDENGAPTPAFLEGLGSLRNHALNKQAMLEKEPWIDWPVPTKTAVITDNGGWFRTRDPLTILAEAEVMRLMGHNGYVNIDDIMLEKIRKREGIGKHFTRAKGMHAGGGFGIPTVKFADNTLPIREVGDGCPYLPANRESIHDNAKRTATIFLENATATGTEEVWGLTIDEIGNVFGRSNEDDDHPGSCPHCSEAFRDMVKADGRTLEDFGAKSWEEIRPVQGYWALDYWESLRILTERVAEAQKAMDDATKQKPIGLGGPTIEISLEDEEPVDHAANLMAARERYRALTWNSKVLHVPEEERVMHIDEEGWHLLQYYSRRFLERTSAMMFNPLRTEIKKLNAAKAAALAAGDTTSPVARQPWLQGYGLRQPRFTWGGGSLGWFEYYRYADTAMVYETSNRDSRIYQWDSYMNDVGRSLKRFCDVDFGITTKPHRGAPIQRALSAAARGATMHYWYTYGPEWAKGDSFGGSPLLRSKVGFASRLLAASEDVMIGGHWPIEPEVAIVRPRTAEFFSGDVSWENGKWLYMALAHEHIPVNALDEFLIEQSDLSGYKVIVIAGSHVRLKTAQRLKQWVADGGTLYTCGFGMAKDEAGRPLAILHEVFGVTDRLADMPTWGTTRRYGATAVRPITPTAETPADSAVTSQSLIQGNYQPEIGSETLQPTATAQVLATNAAGQPVAVANSFGKGKAYLIGTYAGMEYASDIIKREPYDAGKRSWVTAPVLAAGVEPIVKSDNYLVEGVLVENKATGQQALAICTWHLEKYGQPTSNVTIQFRGFGHRRTVKSVALQQELEATIDGEWMTVTLPELGDGDVLLLE